MRWWRVLAWMFAGWLSVQGSAIAYDGSALRGVDARIWGGIAGTSWIAQGEGGRIIYAFIDPNCPYSRDLFRKAQSLIDPAISQIRWIPVGVLPRVTEDSRYKSATALKGGRKALNALMSGGQVMARPTDDELRQVDDSARFLRQEIGPYVQAGVPKLVYIREPGNEVKIFTGVPPDKDLSKIMR